eukprot:5279058-Pleurochrysis_carterae.AAC.1
MHAQLRIVAYHAQKPQDLHHVLGVAVAISRRFCAGFIVCNPLGERRRLTALLHSTMPPVLCFFFFTTGEMPFCHATSSNLLRRKMVSARSR